MFEWIANLFYQYGLFGAGIPSHHGGFEQRVPSQLQDMINK